MAEISIAVCDDLESGRISLARMIRAYARARALPVRVRLFSGGESLLAALAGSEPIHLLFLDIYMPGMSGVEAARRIRRAGSAVPIIFATTSQDHGLESFEVQASDYLVKPFGRRPWPPVWTGTSPTSRSRCASCPSTPRGSSSRSP